MIFNPHIELMPIPKLRELQNSRLQDMISRVYNNVPFYRQKFDDLGIDPKSIKTVADLPKLPFTKKDDLRDNYPFDLFAVPQSEVSRLHCSSGTTGKPTVVGYTRADVDLFAEVVARSLAAAGCEPGMKLQNAYGYGLFTGGLGLHYGAEKLGMNVIPISGGGTDRQIMLLKDFQADAICATPSYALAMAEEMKKRGVTMEEINLKYAILGSEPWSEAVRDQIQYGLNVKASNIYGLSEIIGPGVSNEDFEEIGTGSYVWEDHFFPEIIDPETGEPVEEGKTGVLVITTLTKQALPLVRYWTNDITSLYYDRSGKRTHIKMGPIIGRSDDMLIIRGVNFFHSQVADVLKHVDYVTPNYQVIVSRSGSMDNVEVKIEIDDEYVNGLGLKEINDSVVENSDCLLAIRRKLEKKIKDNIGLTMKVTLVNTGHLPRSEGGKLNRIIDNRKIFV